MAFTSRHFLLILFVALVFFTYQAHAFGAGNIASIAAIEGRNFRHGDIEDMLKQVACIRHHKWNSMMIKRVYFGNWLRDYSQAMDTAALKKAPGETIRVLVWLLSFLGFGYATAEFEVTAERLGVYRPEEHIDNPKDYNENEDARPYDPRLRGPVRDVELQIDPETGMKNYIANGKGDWATSAAYVKYSFERSIHHGRLYTNGHGLFKGKDEDLAEALRCLGQGLHTLEDFGAHTNYVELSLRELGFDNVFAHVGTDTAINLRGKHVFPLVTGTFGTVDFYHSVLGEATDHFTQSEVNEMDNALGTAQQAASSSNPLFSLVKLLSKVPGTRDLCDEAERLQSASIAQARENNQGGWGGPSGGGWRGIDSYEGSTRGPGDFDGSRVPQPDYSAPEVISGPGGYSSNNWNDPNQGWNQGQPRFNDQQHMQGFNNQNQFPGTQPQWQQSQQSQNTFPHDQTGQQNPLAGAQGTPSQPLQQPTSNPTALPGLPNFDPAKTIQQIYPILAFRDKVVRSISAVIEKIPGLEALVDRITETLTVFILSLLAPFVRPVINAISKSLQSGSSVVIDSSGRHQYEVWTNPQSSDPTHSMLSKDHFSNLLNEPAGLVASDILKFIVPRVLYAWEHPDVPVEQVMRDVESIFHHPAIRDERVEIHRTMFSTVQKWVNGLDDRGRSLNDVLSSEGVRSGRNHKAGVNPHIPGQHHNTVSGMAHQFGYGQQQSSNSAFGAVGNVFNSFTGHGGSHNQSHGNSPFGMVGNMIGSFSGHGQQQHHSQGGFGDVLNLAGKLPIPGVSNIAGTMNKFSHFMPGGGRRGIDENEDYGGSRGVSGADDDIDLSAPTNPFFSQLGGAREMHEARQNSPSPAPLQAPSGYEMYGQQQSNQGYQYQQSQHEQGVNYGQGQGGYYGGGGQGDGYYR